MSIGKFKARPIHLPAAMKREVRTQFGALCWRRRKGKLKIALVTSRRSGRWVLPKGWPMDGATPADAAAREAWEEAGVEGRVVETCIGIYSYTKEMEDRADLPCVVAVFPVKARSVAKSWPEDSERVRRWVSPAKAADLVDDPELGQILRGFDPRAVGA
ncbi:MAG: NUDIX hydrolase [Pseudomonadota bacterium]